MPPSPVGVHWSNGILEKVEFFLREKIKYLKKYESKYVLFFFFVKSDTIKYSNIADQLVQK